MGKPEHERLQRYFDGELSADERLRCEAELTDDDRERLAALGELRGLIVATLETEAAGVDLWSGIEKAITPAPRRRLRGRFARRIYGAGLALAAAAALVLFLRAPRRYASNEAEVELLDFDGAMASVMKLQDPGQAEAGPTTTVIWTEE